MKPETRETMTTDQPSEAMRLTDLNPRWISFPGAAPSPDTGVRVGITFRCPCRPGCTERLAVGFTPAIDVQGYGARGLLTWPDGSMRCWQRSGDTFETLTLQPSINASGHWHGFITDGEMMTA
jgi:hypothetical protein